MCYAQKFFVFEPTQLGWRTSKIIHTLFGALEFIVFSKKTKRKYKQEINLFLLKSERNRSIRDETVLAMSQKKMQSSYVGFVIKRTRRNCEHRRLDVIKSDRKEWNCRRLDLWKRTRAKQTSEKRFFSFTSRKVSNSSDKTFIKTPREKQKR